MASLHHRRCLYVLSVSPRLHSRILTPKRLHSSPGCPSSPILSWGAPSTPETTVRSPKKHFPVACALSPRPRCRISGYSVTRSGAVGRDLEAAGAPTSVPVRVALELLQAGHRYLDVRTPEEFSASHVPGAVNVPYMFKVGSGMTKNDLFLEDVASSFGKDDEIIVGCQSGKRSLMAASVLLSAGYTNITDVSGGYTAWLENGLPSTMPQPKMS